MRPPRRPRASAEYGYTLIELQIALLILFIIAGVAVANVRTALSVANGDGAMAQVASVLRYGRDLAISGRRPIDVLFTNPNRIQLRRTEDDGSTTVVTDVRLEHRAEFRLDDGLPDTPDGYGRAAAVDFDNAATIRFTADGMLTDATGVPINGTVFLETPDDRATARAVTVTGGSARAQPYRWTGRDWQEQ